VDPQPTAKILHIVPRIGDLTSVQGPGAQRRLSGWTNGNQAPADALAIALLEAAFRAEYLREQFDADGGGQGFREQFRMLPERGFKLVSPAELDELSQQGLKFPWVPCHQFGHRSSVLGLSRHPLPSVAGGSTY
jgi:hypothetical protein